MNKKSAKHKDPADKILLLAALPYALWVIFYLVCFYVKMPLFSRIGTPAKAVSFGFMAANLVCAVIAVLKIKPFRYVPFIILASFVLTGRLISFLGAFIFLEITGKTLYLLPFGGIDFFLFYFLVIGLFRHLTKMENTHRKIRFNALNCLPIIFFSCPVFFHVIREPLSALSIYSFFYTIVIVAALGYVISLWRSYPEKKLLFVSIVLAAVSDMLIYTVFSGFPDFIPPMLNYLFLPFSLFLFCSAVIAEKKKVK